MRRLVRLLLVIASAAVVLAGTLTAVTVLGQGMLSHAASSEAIPLLPIGTSTLEGSTVYADDGTTVLANFRGSELRRPITLSQVSPTLIKAVLDTEDERFYIHGGVDLPSTVRALASDSSSSGGLQGGSTITQQLVKQTYLSSQRTVSRKIKEAVLAERMQQKYTKNQILQAYLNIIYLGNSAYGVQAAANLYFNEPASQLDLPQAALLAGLIQNPNGYDPIHSPLAARTRRSEVLARMVHYGDITQAQADAANATALPTPAVIAPTAVGDTISDYYVNEVKSELLGNTSPLGGNYNERYQALFEGGLKIITNLDPTLQNLAKTTVARDTPANPSGFEQAMVVVDPATGKVKAMVGGSGSGSAAQFDVVTEGSRQPGSGFKLFTLVAALEAGYSPYSTVDATAPCAIAFPGNNGFLPPNKPATNDEGPGSGGVVNLVTATAQSLNCGFLRLGHEVGLPQIAAVAQKMGITTPLTIGNPKTGATSYAPSMILGSLGVHPIDMAAAYATVADNGIYHAPSFIDTISDRSGSVIYSGVDKGHRVISAQVAAEATLGLNAVVSSGTGTGAALYNRQVAGKTGTTTGPTDAWFNGFVPQLEATVWMGSPYNTKSVYIHGAAVYGGTYPTHTWHDFMAAALANVPAVPFEQPNPSLIPAARYITSPSLVRDDHTDHNYYGNPTPAPARSPYPGSSGGGGTGATTPAAPAGTVAPPAGGPAPPAGGPAQPAGGPAPPAGGPAG